MALNAFRAGSGSYQQVRPIQITVTSVPSNSTAVETYSATIGNIVQGSIADLTTDSLVATMLDSASGFLAANGLVLMSSQISATGTLMLTWSNLTNAPINPGNIQLDVLVF